MVVLAGQILKMQSKRYINVVAGCLLQSDLVIVDILRDSPHPYMPLPPKMVCEDEAYQHLVVFSHLLSDST